MVRQVSLGKESNGGCIHDHLVCNGLGAVFVALGLSVLVGRRGFLKVLDG